MDLPFDRPTPQQRAIHDWLADGDGNAVVRARAGTGKTTTLRRGIERARAERILVCAFNKEIEKELSAKITDPRADVKTLHGLGYSFFADHWPRHKPVGERRVYRLAQSVCGAVSENLARAIGKLAGKAKEMAPLVTNPRDLFPIARRFDCLPEPDATVPVPLAPAVDRVAKAFEMLRPGGGIDAVDYLLCAALATMEASCQPDALGEIDFADMIFVPLRNGWVRDRADLLLVDEAQDMNLAQLLLAQRACAKDGRILVVGDDRQAIYGFRGADSDALDRLKRELNAVEFPLTVTHRCPRAVVEVARQLVPDFEAAPGAPLGSVAELEARNLLSAVTPGDFVISRKNAPLVGLCLALVRARTPARIQGKDIGKELMQELDKVARRASTVGELLRQIQKSARTKQDRALALGDQGKAADARDRADMFIALAENAASVKEVRDRIESMFSDSEGRGRPQVVLTTIHKAKGLERDRVFVLKDTLYPYKNARNNVEEVNLEYVAITRAKRELIWVVGDPREAMGQA
jgi:superfamily I DNA/RNA helicase